jgi:molybdate transport system permease protein
MPLAVYLALETNPEKAIVLALVLIAVSFAVLVALRDRWLGAATTAVGPR